ncbi:interferon-induced protein with tetratricopeptide repeats 5 [Biomphalaria glabrata]|nr:interferon-induced protein with tetratricopeptide repeats 5 [Biomphalaria glabrata]
MSLNINEDLKEFPCTFNLARGHKVTQERFRHVKNNVESEIDCSPEEQIRNKNILTWVLFNLGDKHKAEELNREALKDSEDKNITALGNNVFILYNKGYKLKPQNTAFQKLLELSKDERFEHMKIEALAEQAYCYTRLGGEQNYKICIDLFKKCVDRCPHNYDWKFGLGLVYRRFTNFSSISQEQKEELIAESAQLLFEVARCGNDKLKGLAYAQLVVGYMTFPKQQDRVFKDYDVQSLCEEALKYGDQNPTVLTHVGRCLKDLDVDKAIDLLKKSLELRLNSIACHHLGLCYEKKFENKLLQRKPCPLDDSKHQKASSAADSKHQKESSAADSKHQKESSAADSKHQKESSAADSKHQKESSAADNKHQKESSAADSKHQKESSADDSKHQKESSADVSKHQKESSADDSKHQKESSAADSKHQKESSAADSKHQKESSAADSKHQKESSAADSKHQKESSADDSKHQKESSADDSKHQKESSAADSKHQKESSAADSKHQKESSAADSKHQKESSAADSKHQKESSAADSKHQKESSAADSKHQKESSAADSKHQKESSAADSKHQKESSAADSKPLTGQTNESLLDSTITTSSMMQDTSSSIDQTSTEEDFLMEAERCYIKAIEISYDENIPAKLHLGDFYFRLEKFDKALAQYNQIIDSNQGSSYLLCLVNARDKAGKCLKTYNDPDSLNEAHEQFTKAIALAADLVSSNRESAESTSAIWESFKKMLDENEQMPQSRTKNKNKIKLLELVQAHRDIVLLVVQTFGQDSETDDLDIVKSGLTSGLKSGQYEDALLILNLASTIAAITLNPLWSDPEMIEIRAETYLTTAWARLIKDSPDYIRTFQQMFQLRYGQCVGMVSEAEEETLTKKGDILIVNDETLDSEDGPDITTKLASNLLNIFQVIFGLGTSRNLEMSTDYSHMQEEALLQEMSNYSLVLLVVGDNDSHDYNSMLEAVHKVQGPDILLVSLRAQLPIPLILQSKEVIHVARVLWNHIRFTETLLQSCQEPTSNDIINTLFQGDKVAIVRLFCCLVGKEFHKILQIFKSKDL